MRSRRHAWKLCLSRSDSTADCFPFIKPNQQTRHNIAYSIWAWCLFILTPRRLSREYRCFEEYFASTFRVVLLGTFWHWRYEDENTARLHLIFQSCGWRYAPPKGRHRPIKLHSTRTKNTTIRTNPAMTIWKKKSISLYCVATWRTAKTHKESEYPVCEPWHGPGTPLIRRRSSSHLVATFRYSMP
jgi:hypothetical protein